MSPELTYHGVRYDPDRKTGHLLFGIEALLRRLLELYRLPPIPGVNDERPDWPNMWFDRKFDRACSKLRDTLFKFDRVAGYAETCSRAACQFYDGQPMEEAAPALRAQYDLPIHLDSMLLYFRIQADCLADVIPNFYGRAGQTINRYGFRKQAEWFTKTRPDFDTEYAEILRRHLDWLGILSDYEGGVALRDAVVHRRGVYQLGWVESQGKASDMIASLANESGFLSDDVMSSLRTAFANYCEYLDAAYVHFAARIAAAIGTPVRADLDGSCCLYRFEGSHSSLWVYPEVGS